MIVIGRPAAALLVAVALSGCAAPAASSGDSTPATSPVPSSSAPSAAGPTVVDPACSAIYQGASSEKLTPETTLDSVTVCRVEGGKATTATLTRQMSQEMLDSLAGLLAEPSSPIPSGPGACTLELRVRPDFVVTTSEGRLLAPVVPTDECAKESLAVVRLLAQVQ